ncbi:unnamed protein product [Eruca vesicaria subsp. sativa]|uniref:Dentin sialophosphoprotein-like n=1 Tax=Eruca vesicaria subsp. sativa TaxID=29727 RepID=A0ABC8LDR4_ERUVS|nr:unnamed protein product [Eruca vesicaria subsp. sativa]
MEEQREGTELVGDAKVPTEEETGKGSSKIGTLGCEDDVNTVEVLGSGVCDVSVTDETLNVEGSSKIEYLGCDGDDKTVEVLDSGVSENQNDGGSGKIVSSHDIEKHDPLTEPEAERSQAECDGGGVEVKLVNGGSCESGGGGEETVISAGNKVGDEKGTCEVGDGGDDADATTSDTEQNVQTEKSQKILAGGETLSAAAEDKADQEKESANESEEDNTRMDVGSKQANEENVGSETKDGKHSESVQVPEVSSAAEEELENVNQKEENREAMEIDSTAEELVKKDGLDNAGNEFTATQDVPIAEAERSESNVVKETENDVGKDNTDMANPNSSTEDAAPSELEPLDDNALFDPRSDITNFIDFSSVSSWSGNIQDHKTESGNVSLKEDKKATDMADEVATDECNEAPKSVGATEGQKEDSDAVMGSEEIQKDHQISDEKALDQQDTRREEDDTTHEVPSNDPNQKEDTVMEENPNNFDYADSETKTNGLKRKADVLSEDSLGEGRKTVSLAKVSFAHKPSFKIGAGIARAASQMAGSPSVLKGSNFGDENLSVESFVSQLHCAATGPDKESVVSETAAGFFLDFRNSKASQALIPEKASSKRGKPSNSPAGGTEAFEFEEMGDTYWTDRVIHNGGEEQAQPTEKENYQVVPVELKPAQVKRTRRPYRRRQSQIMSPLTPASNKPADFDENAPAELIMTFSEMDTIPPEKSLSKMFRHFGPIRDSQTEVDTENKRARVVFRKGADAEVAYKSAGRFNIFGTKAVNYELSFTVTETFKVQPYVVSLGDEEAVLPAPS